MTEIQFGTIRVDDNIMIPGELRRNDGVISLDDSGPLWEHNLRWIYYDGKLVSDRSAIFGVNYDELGAATADLALEVLQTGTVPEYQIVPGGIVTVNTETAAALGLDPHVFDSLGGTLVEVTTAAE